MTGGALSATVLYNEPLLPEGHPDRGQEAGVLESVHACADALAAAGMQVRTLGARADVGSVLSGLLAPRPDVVINLCEGFGGDTAGEARVAAVLELLGLPFSGSGSTCLGLVRDKARTKALLRGAGLPTPDFVVWRAGTPLPRAEMDALVRGGPVIVKPACEDASLGIGPGSVVGEAGELLDRVRDVASRYGDVLVERFVDGRELNVAVVALPKPRALPPAEIEFRPGAPRLVTYDAKWAEDSADWQATPVRCPAVLAPDLEEAVKAIGLLAFAATGCRDYARIDLRVDADGRPYVLEVNGNPDAAPSAGLARMVRAAGGTIDGFYADLARVAASRGAGRGDASPTPSRKRDSGVLVRELRRDDVEPLVAVLSATGAFRPDEVEVGREVLDEAARDGRDGHYQVLVAEDAGRPVGWAGWGLVPLTDATWDLYWIAVDPCVQGRGVGRVLLEAAEAAVRGRGGRWLLAETSGTDAYGATRAFYRGCGYQVVSDIPDFYRPGDPRVTFGRRLDRRG